MKCHLFLLEHFYAFFFFLKASFQFAQKFICQFQKSIKQVCSKPFRLQTLDIAKRFGEPLHRQNLVLFVCSFLTIIASLYIGISFAEIVRDDCDDASILACEMICETGPDFKVLIESSSLETILRSYSKYLEHKHLASLLRVLTGYSAENNLAAALQTVSDIDIESSQKEVANNIWRAGEEVMLFRLNTPRLLPRSIRLHEHRKVPKELVIDIKEALEGSRKALRLLNEKPSLERAVYSCEANRQTMLLLFLARNSGLNKLFDDFQKIVEACRDRKIDLAKRIQNDDPRKEFITMTAEFDQRRLDMLDALNKGDIQQAIDLMWKSIKIAYSRREALLELCNKLRGHPSWDVSLKPP